MFDWFTGLFDTTSGGTPAIQQQQMLTNSLMTPEPSGLGNTPYYANMGGPNTAYGAMDLNPSGQPMNAQPTPVGYAPSPTQMQGIMKGMQGGNGHGGNMPVFNHGDFHQYSALQHYKPMEDYANMSSLMSPIASMQGLDQNAMQWAERAMPERYMNAYIKSLMGV